MNKAQRIRYYTKYKARKQYDERRNVVYENMNDLQGAQVEHFVRRYLEE